MNPTIKVLALAVACSLVLTQFAGCVSPVVVAQKETMLLAEGFKVIPATTPEQQRLLRTLPSDRVSVVRRAGKVYFVYPDAGKNALYVGDNDAYLAYEAHAQAQGLESTDWAAWGDWDAQ